MRRLVRGIPGEVDRTDTITFIDRSSIPENIWRYFIYGPIVKASDQRRPIPAESDS